jgi:hypothetical protein
MSRRVQSRNSEVSRVSDGSMRHSFTRCAATNIQPWMSRLPPSSPPDARVLDIETGNM